MPFLVFITLVVFQRLSELIIAKRNAKWLLSKGAKEYGRGHYPLIVTLHTAFILSMIVEYCVGRGKPGYVIEWPDVIFLSLFVTLLVFKYWVISSLGKYWNTRIYRVPGFAGVSSGPYRFLKHPNYLEVVGEIAIMPLVFHLYYTAIIFTILNAMMLTYRIRIENKAWEESL